MTPKEVVQAFNAADVDALANLYSDDAVNHQFEGRDAIRNWPDWPTPHSRLATENRHFIEQIVKLATWPDCPPLFKV
jgi:ketosteroid isomerase-like protein